MRLHNLAKDADSRLTISEEDLKILHKALMVIMDDLLSICKNYNLNFVLIGGTAIGALRHHGFIPWDDDIDIAMPRADFNKLISIIHNKYADKYYILNPADKRNYGRVIPKIGLKGTEYRTALGKDLDECGIFFDIYIIENIPDNWFLQRLQGIMAMFCGYALSCRRLYKREYLYEGMNDSLNFKIKSKIGGLFSFASLDQWARWTDYWHSCCKNNSSKYISMPSDGKHYFGGIFKRSVFLDYKKVDFEGRECQLPGNYDEFLRGYYGDYMKMPPKEKRQRSKYISFNPGKYKDL